MIDMNKKKNKIADSLEEVLAVANASYDRCKEEKPQLYREEDRIHFVQGWLKQAYNNLYKKIEFDNL